MIEKLTFRHPHIFGDIQAKTADVVIKNWEQLKAKKSMETKQFFPVSRQVYPHLLKLSGYKIKPGLWVLTGKKRAGMG